MLENTEYKWQIETFKCGEKIVADADILWSIKQGTVKISTYDLEGRIIILGYWGKNDVVGQPLTKIDPYEIECLTPVKATSVPYRDWHYLSKEIRNCFQDAEKMLYILGQKNIDEKLTELLIYLGNKFGDIHERGKAILLPLSHQELANFLGTTRVVITRAINRLQSKKMIENPKRGLIILHISGIDRLNYKI